MASIRKRGSSWHVQIRQSGQPSLTRSFKKKPDAVAWGRLKRRVSMNGLRFHDLRHEAIGRLDRHQKGPVMTQSGNQWF